MNRKVRAIAFYLPQFYPIPENDEWWGEGFTEWTNVKKATPLFKGHHQPNLPGELGFYDLRNSDIRDQQAQLAQAYGIEGFCYWHYWFGNGKRILERVFDEVLDSGKPDFPFCLAWANETWTGIWHGAKNKILIKQTYPGEQDYIDHFNFLIRAFKDTRYIKVEGKPFFVVYRPHEIDSLDLFVKIFRAEAEKQGLPGIYLVGNNVPDDWDPRKYGFDASGPARLHNVVSNKRKLLRRLNGISTRLVSFSIEEQLKGPFVYDYKKSLTKMLRKKQPAFKSFPCVIPNWDNTPRSGRRGWVLQNATPYQFGEFLRKAVEAVKDYPEHERFVFIKSWNEWAEGNYLEPDLLHGRGYLEACRKIIINH